MTVQSVVRAFDILKYIAVRPNGIGITALAVQTGLPKSTVSRLVTTLEAVTAVSPVPNEQTYQLNPAFVAQLSPPSFPENLIALARPFLQELNREVGEDVGLAIPDGQTVLYIDQVSNDAAVQVKDWTGHRIPLHLVSSGKVILAHQSSDFVARYLERPLAATTPKTLTTPLQIQNAITKIRAQGVDWSIGEFDLAINAVSAPILNQTNQAIAVLNIYGPAYRFPAGQQEHISQLILTKSQNLTKEIQNSPDEY